jgi:tRNA G46 methylase TrmB
VWDSLIGVIGTSEVIFDLGCGVGESSFHLSRIYPNCKVVGVDKSLSRLERNNSFKSELSTNISLFRGELLDLIPLIYNARKSLKIKKIFVLYPNPYPKKHHIKRRFHGSPVSIFLYGIGADLVFRSNWKLYLEEAQLAGKFFKRNSSSINELIISEEDFMTPFEKKFALSNQPIFELTIT